MPAARHLLTVWNPSYAESAMDAHLEVLLSGVEEREGVRAEADEEPPYVWWARLRSPNRQQPLPHGAAWLLGQLPYQLTRLAELRNPAAHAGSVEREAAVAQREEVLGIGQEGVVVRVARARMRTAAS